MFLMIKIFSIDGGITDINLKSYAMPGPSGPFREKDPKSNKIENHCHLLQKYIKYSIIKVDF